MSVHIRSVLVANRGEIARRIFRTCREMAIDTVAVYSDADADAPFVGEADRAVRLAGTAASDTYLRGELIIAAAQRAGADAVHPGYGFLSENAAFAQAVIDAGLTWIGPPPEAIAAMGSKIEAKALMRGHGVPVAADSTVATLDEIGLPALVKASAGGGGRGMRIVRDRDELAEAIGAAEREAAAAFGDGTVFVERYMDGARHVEVQVLADQHGNVVALGERDCTLQRRQQKVLEESPSPAVDADLRASMCAAAVAAAKAVGYVGAGTVEFLLDAGGDFSFLEMNTRLQVEHPVTEMVTGLDLVALQLHVAAGGALPPAVTDNLRTQGHAIEVRLCAEDPYQGYRPSSGTFHVVEWAVVPGVRVDSAIEDGTVVPPYYDSMVAKVIAHGRDRADAARRLVRCLERSTIVGPTTNRELLIELVTRLAVLDADGTGVDTGWLDRQDLGQPPSPTALQLAAAALALVRRRAPGGYPTGWRNNPSQLHRHVLGVNGEHVIEYRFDRRDRLQILVVDGEPLELDGFTRDALDRIDTYLVDGVLDGAVAVDHGRVALVIPPRFVSPDDAGRAGSTVAPMPGKVVQMLVAVGDDVVAGQPLLTIEAMKMEHQIVSPHSGVVAEVFVAAGQQLDHGQPLLRVEGG